NSDKSCVAKAYERKEMLFCDRFCDDFVTLLRRRLDTSKIRGLKQQILFGLKPSDVVMLVLITSQDGLVFGQNIMWTGYECWIESEYILPCPILFVLAASVV
ncbi:hypothetical protein Tco_0671020, partial [Tanacetum coccineum]